MTLDAFLEQDGSGGVNRLAEVLGVTASTVSKWRYGRLLPSLKDSIAIERATDGAVRPGDLVNARGPRQARKRRPLVRRAARRAAQ